MKYLTKEVKIAIVGIVSIAILFMGLHFLKGVNIFQSSNTYYIMFSDIKGLAKSGAVHANGFKIGSVRDIVYDYDNPGRVLVEISVDQNMCLPYGTKGKLVSEILGGSELHLVLGDDVEHNYVPGDTLGCDETAGIIDQAASYIPMVEQIIIKVDSLLTTLNTLASDPNLTGVIADAKDITANLNDGSREFKDILDNDIPQLADKMNQIGDNVATFTGNLNEIELVETFARLDTVLSNLQLMTETLKDNTGTLGLLLNDTTLYENLSLTMGSANNLLIDLKENPKRYVHFSLFGRKNQ